MARHKAEAINLRMSPEMKSVLRFAAAREHRTLSNMIEYLLLDYCERHAIARPLQSDASQAAGCLNKTAETL